MKTGSNGFVEDAQTPHLHLPSPDTAGLLSEEQYRRSRVGHFAGLSQMVGLGLINAGRLLAASSRGSQSIMIGWGLSNVSFIVEFYVYMQQIASERK